MNQFKRWLCRRLHRNVMFPGGGWYECRTCGERFENPALDGALMPLPAITASVRQVGVVAEWWTRESCE